MGADFPVPRAQLPRVEVSPHERQVRSMQMERALLLALDEYDRFRTRDQGRMDAARWKLVEAQGMLQLFRERATGSKPLGSSAGTTSAASFSASDDDSISRGHWDDDAASLADGRDKHRSLRMVGDVPGRVDSALYAAITKTTHEFALVQTFLYDDVADCTILNELEGPTQENPLQFLGYKWVVKKAAGGGRLGKHRDVVYLESCGITTTRAGEEIGYVLLESVDLEGFPEMTNRNCVRAAQFVSILLRQKSENVIEVFATGVAEPTGSKVMRPMTTQLAAQTMLALTKSMELAECKRLTKMLVSQRRAREEVLYNLKHKPTNCSLCHQKRKFYNGVSLVDCSICGHVICTRCQTHKRVFIADGVLGRFHRVGCCKTCVLAADRTRPMVNQAPIKMSISAQLQRQNSSREFDSIESHSFSRPRSSSESSVGDLNEFTVKQGLQPTLEEETTMPADASHSRRRGSVDFPSSRQPAPAGITLLPSGSVPQDRSVTRAANTPRRSAAPTSLVVATVRQPEPQPLVPPPRHRGGSGASGRFLLTQGHEAAPQPIRPSPSPPTFTSSAPAGTYDLRGQMGAGGYGAMPSMPKHARPSAPTGGAGGAGSSQQDLFARMMELRRLAESTYQTTQQNERIMQQQRTPSHAAARPGSRF